MSDYPPPMGQDAPTLVATWGVPTAPPAPVSPPPNRIIVVETVQWIPGESGQGTPADSRFCRWLETEKDPCGPRRFKATPEWQPLDLGWLDSYSFLVIVNEAIGAGLQNRDGTILPGEPGLVLEIALEPNSKGALLVRPGQSVRFEPLAPRQCRIRCPGGPCRYTLTVFPS